MSFTFQHVLGPGPGLGAVGTLGTMTNTVPIMIDATQRMTRCHTRSPEGVTLPNLGTLREGFLEVAWLGLSFEK